MGRGSEGDVSKDTELLLSDRNKFERSTEHCDITVNVKVLYFKKISNKDLCSQYEKSIK